MSLRGALGKRVQLALQILTRLGLDEGVDVYITSLIEDVLDNQHKIVFAADGALMKRRITGRMRKYAQHARHAPDLIARMQ